MGWKIVEIEECDSVNLFLNNLVFKNNNNERITISINDIDVLLINNFKLKITIQLINALTENNILTIICDNKYLPSSMIVPIIGNYNTIKVLDNQLNWNHKWKSQLWKSIIEAKIKSEIEVLTLFNKDIASIKALEEFKLDIKEYDATNREGHASKVYWHSLFGSNFKRHNDDYTNTLLNYGYTILRSYFTRSIIKKGLDPRISIFHKSFHNYFSLSSDLMEPFRFIVDIKVMHLIKNNNSSFYDDKQEIINTFNRKIKINGKYQFINNAIDIFVDSIVNQTNIPIIEFDDELV